MSDTIGDIAAAARGRADLEEKLAAFYRDIDAAVAERSPICTNRGLCCNFDAFGHDLFVTAVELAYFVGGHHDAWLPVLDERRCPYQIDGLCTARERRPMGCRVFFCDASSTDWQNAEYEKRLSELKRIGDELGVEYRYAEWLSALGSVPEGAVRPAPTGPKGDPRAESVDPRSLPVIESE